MYVDCAASRRKVGVHRMSAIDLTGRRSAHSSDPVVSFRRAAAGCAVLVLCAVLAACGRADGAAEGHGPGAGGPPPAAVAVEKVVAANLPASFEYVGQTA